MFKGYRNHIFYKDQTNKTLDIHPQISKCTKCSKLNTISHSPAFNNVHICYFCSQPFYIIKTN